MKSINEAIKINSNFLRGNIANSLNDKITGGFSDTDQQLIKFHGFYQQDAREIRTERKLQKLEPLYSFMLRARIPGGIVTPKQWLALDEISSNLTKSCTIRLTSRQTFQYHGISKSNLKAVIKELDLASMDSIAACGDVNRNVTCNPNPLTQCQREVYDMSVKISNHFLPKTSAYTEIWLNDELITSDKKEEEPIYKETYLPRKFKMAIAIPPSNDVDVYTNDLGLIAIIEKDKLIGFNLVCGGGMGTTHGDKRTYPRLADEIGFIPLNDTIKFVEAVVTAQRDLGNRSDRKLSRLKYTIDAYGIDKFKQELEQRANQKFEPWRPVNFTSRGDIFGWHQSDDKNWHLSLFIPEGRIKDNLQQGLREIALIHKGDFRMTANHNLIIANVTSKTKEQINKLVSQYELDYSQISPSRKYALACVALPTCPLAMAEAERFLPEFIDSINAIQKKYKIEKQPIVTRITGCPNGCVRPFVAEIGLVGKALGRYNLYLGADFTGTRLNKIYLENKTVNEILDTLDKIIKTYASDRLENESFGDYVIRAKIVQPVSDAKRDFHA